VIHQSQFYAFSSGPAPPRQSVFLT
jgi:hypothetical protein